MVTFENFYSIVFGRTDKTKEELQNWFNSINIQELYDLFRPKYRAELWDNTPINGVEPSIIRERHNMSPDQKAYVIYIDGRLSIFQPRSVTGVPITSENWQLYANEHIEDMCDGLVMRKLLELLGVRP